MVYVNENNNRGEVSSKPEERILQNNIDMEREKIYFIIVTGSRDTTITKHREEITKDQQKDSLTAELLIKLIICRRNTS